jgi:hypothetical protein
MPRGIFKRKPAEERFWDKVNKNTGTDCWHFTGSIAYNGYGQFKFNGKIIKAHRFSYELNKGPIPDGMCILHACDNRLCVNPDHLSIGTQRDNVYDMINKNRKAIQKGSLNGMSKLTEDQVKLIKRRIASGEKQVNLAKEYGVNKSQITEIKIGRTWAHVKI